MPRDHGQVAPGTLSAGVVSTQYHYTPVLAWNNANGMMSTFTYSFSLYPATAAVKAAVHNLLFSGSPALSYVDAWIE